MCLALLATFFHTSVRDDGGSCVVLQDDRATASRARPRQVDWVEALAFSPDGTLLASGRGRPGAPGACQLWDVARRQIQAILPTGDAVYAVTFSPDGQTVALGNWDGTIALWEVGTRREVGVLRLPEDRARALAFSPAGDVLAAALHGTVVLWDLTTGRERATLTGSSPVAFSPDGRTLATGMQETAGARLWDWQTGQAQGEFHVPLVGPGLEPAICTLALAFTPDGKTLISAESDASVRFWDVEQQRLRVTHATCRDQGLAVAFSPNRRLLATAGIERTVVLRDSQTNQLVAELPGHTGAIHCLAFAPDGRTLASGGFDGTVRLWNVAVGRGGTPP